MGKITKFDQRGLALLETAAVLGIVLVLFSVTLALVEYCRANWNITAIIDRYVYDQAARPYLIKNEEGGASIELDRYEVSEAIDHINDRISTEVIEMLNNWGVSSSARQYVESGYVEMLVDPVSGKYKALSAVGGDYLQSAGDADIKMLLDKQVTLTNIFEEASTRVIKGPDGSIALYAVASAPVIDMRETNSFLPSVVLVATRVGISFKDTWIGALLDMLGLDPFISRSKVIGLRAEIGM